MAFLKQASLKIENPEISVDSWVGNNSGNVKTASNKLIEYKKILADFNPDDYLLTHCTIVASVNVEEAPEPMKLSSDKIKKEFGKLEGKKDWYISPDTSKYINANGDSWSREIIKDSYKTFIGAENYVEHVQDPKYSKGKILDAAIREVDDGKSVFVDILVATSKNHKDLVEKIKTGKLTTLSMGSVVAFTICTRCGNVATDDTNLCSHIRFLKRNSFISENDGKKRVIAELCGHALYPDSNHFIEGSWVETPAFKGAVLRNEIKLGEEKEEFAKKYVDVMNLKSPDLKEAASRVIAAFQLVDKVKTSKTDESLEIKDPEFPEGTEPPEDLKEEKPKEEIPVPEEEPKEEPKKEEPVKEEIPVPAEEPEVPKEEPKKEDKEPKKEEAPVEPESKPEELPAELSEMADQPIPEESVEEEAKKPFNEIKEDIKKNLKDQIKKELLMDLGINLGTKPTPTNINNVNLNDSLVNSSLTISRNASNIDIKALVKEGYSKEVVLKMALLSNKYSINKDIYRIVNALDLKGFPSSRRCAKEVERVLGRELVLKERQALDRLIEDLG